MLTRRVMLLTIESKKAGLAMFTKWQPNTNRLFQNFRSYSDTNTASQTQTDSSDNSSSSVDPNEMQRFKQLANNWWVENGEFGALHRMNVIRVPLVRDTMINYRESLSKKEKEKLKSYLGDLKNSIFLIDKL